MLLSPRFSARVIVPLLLLVHPMTRGKLSIIGSVLWLNSLAVQIGKSVLRYLEELSLPRGDRFVRIDFETGAFPLEPLLKGLANED